MRLAPLYWQPANGWVGFGADYNELPSLFDRIYRVGFWRVAVCRVCLLTAVNNASALIDQAEAILTQRGSK